MACSQSNLSFRRCFCGKACARLNGLPLNLQQAKSFSYRSSSISENANSYCYFLCIHTILMGVSPGWYSNLPQEFISKMFFFARKDSISAAIPISLTPLPKFAELARAEMRRGNVRSIPFHLLHLRHRVSADKRDLTPVSKITHLPPRVKPRLVG
jgi:hypothetical protein